jgi:ribosomal protein L11 methyltransferase
MPESERSYPSLLLGGTKEEMDAATCALFESGCLGTESIEGAFRERAYFPPGTDLGPLSRKLTRDFPRLRLGPVAMIPEEDWLSLWRKDLNGFALGNRFFVSPSWQPSPDTERVVLRIDPEQAFGTGSHDTTRLCLEFVEDCASPGIGLIDAGTGTGILAMAGAVLGCEPVLAIEIDAAAAACARENVKRNRLESRVEVLTSRLGDARPAPADLVVANLNRPLLDRELPRLSAWLKPRGSLILSGLTVDDMAELLESLPVPMKLLRYYTAGDWAAVLARSADP